MEFVNELNQVQNERVNKFSLHTSYMEPPEVVIPLQLDCNILIFCIDPISMRITRIRGGGDYEPIDRRASTVPKLSQAGFMWDGLPSPTLLHDILYPLYMGLG